MRRWRRGVGIFSMALGVRSFSRRRFSMAAATLVQLVFWTRMAPTIISKGVRPGHQCWGPWAAKRAS